MNTKVMIKSEFLYLCKETARERERERMKLSKSAVYCLLLQAVNCEI